jgi:hypothetical protein
MSGDGIQFPAGADGKHSSSAAGRAAVADALPKGSAEQKACASEKNWRFGYKKHFANHFKAALESTKDAVTLAQSGLDHLHREFQFVRDGKACSLEEALDGRFSKSGWELGEIVGDKRAAASSSDYQCRVPYKQGVLEGDALRKQLKKWEAYGTIEESAAAAISEVSKKGPEWCDLSNRYFVILGALSAMGPYQQLLDLGANIIALDLDRPGIWERLIQKARDSPGRILFPMKKKQSACKDDQELFANAGCNLITHAPEAAAFVSGMPELKGKEITVGCYVYLDGEAHVRVALACDMVMKTLVEKNKANVAFLCTPTDMHVIPRAARDAASENHSLGNVANLPLLPIRALDGKNMLVNNAAEPIKAKDGNVYYFVDGLVVAQGPNYALAKRLQHWRAIVSREVGKVKVSSNVAPSTSTASVVHNKQFAWAYDGMPYFKPLEIFGQETSNAVMTALLVFDISDESSAASPGTKLNNPYEIMSFTGFHGGVWRSAYTVGSIGQVSVLIHFIKVGKPFLLLALLAMVAYKFLM